MKQNSDPTGGLPAADCRVKCKDLPAWAGAALGQGPSVAQPRSYNQWSVLARCAGLGTEEGWRYMYPIHVVPENKLTLSKVCRFQNLVSLQPFYFHDPHASRHCAPPLAWFPAPDTFHDNNDGQYLISKTVKCRAHGHRPCGWSTESGINAAGQCSFKKSRERWANNELPLLRARTTPTTPTTDGARRCASLCHVDWVQAPQLAGRAML